MNPTELKIPIEDIRGVLAEMHDLLEEYAPSWYHSDLRAKVLAALKSLEDSEKETEARR